jgi:exonuclease SbcD
MTPEPFRLLATADWHLGRSLEGFTRLAEQQAVLQHLVQLADAHAVHAVVVAGDVFDAYATDPEAEELCYETLVQLSAGGTRPVLVVAGNHDHPTRLENLEPLAQALGIVLVSRWGRVLQGRQLASGARTLRTDHSFQEWQLPGVAFPIRFLLTPFANTARMGPQVLQRRPYPEALRDHWQELAHRYCDPHGLNLLVGHQLLLGPAGERPAESDSERPVSIGGSTALRTTDLPIGLHAALFGHLHRPQQLQHEPYPVLYTGSVLQYSVSETEQTKQAVLLQGTPATGVEVLPLPLNGGLPVVRMEFDDPETALHWLDANPHCYAEVRLKAPHGISNLTREQLQQAHPHLLALVPVAVQPQNTNNRLQLEDLRSLSAEELFRQFVQHHRQHEPSPELLGLFHELQARKAEPASGG